MSHTTRNENQKQRDADLRAADKAKRKLEKEIDSGKVLKKHVVVNGYEMLVYKRYKDDNGRMARDLDKKRYKK